MTKLYQYVGPLRILEQSRDQPPGVELRSLADVRSWWARQGVHGRELTVTFVIDRAGVLRVADRQREHVACAAGGPVRSAGEMSFTITGARVAVTRVSNQSTGFCPEPASWVEVQRALEGLGVEHPGAFTEAFEFRRCPSCGQINLVKDQSFVCDACEAELPEAWNFGE